MERDPLHEADLADAAASASLYAIMLALGKLEARGVLPRSVLIERAPGADYGCAITVAERHAEKAIELLRASPCGGLGGVSMRYSWRMGSLEVVRQLPQVRPL